MKNTILPMLLVACFAFRGQSKVIFVKPEGTGDGASWNSAFGNLQEALLAAKAGTEIWVAEGTYLPVQCDFCSTAQREMAFHIPSGVKLYGGFSGNESSLSQRKWFAHPTKLSGHIGTTGSNDNTFTVVYFKNLAQGTLLDGFVITGGRADEWSPDSPSHHAGGGLFNDGSGRGGRSVVSIKNCVFIENYAEEGGGIFNHGQMGEAILEIDNCTFVSNRAGKGGGSIFSNNDLGIGKIDLKKCKFVRNEAPFGAAVFITQKDGTGKNQIVSSNFVANKATAGTALFTLAVEDTLQPDFFLCDYVNNDTREGDEIYNCPESTVPKRLLNMVAISVSSKI